MGLQVPHILGQNQRFATKFESTPGTYNPPANTDFIKVLSSDFAVKREQEARDDANEGLDPYEMITMRGDLTATVERYFTPAAAGTSPQEAVLLQSLLCGVPATTPSTSVAFSLLNADPALNRRALTIQRYFNADDVFWSQALTGFVVNEGKFSGSGTEKPKMSFTGKAMGLIEAGYTTTSGTGTSTSTLTLATGSGRYFDVGARINVGADTNLAVSAQAASGLTLGSTISFADAEVVAPYCPTPSITAGAVVGLTGGSFSYGGTAYSVQAWEINVSRNMAFTEDEYGSTYMTDASRGQRVISGKVSVKASRTLTNDLIRRGQFSDLAISINVGATSGRYVNISLPQVRPMIDKLNVSNSGVGTFDIPFVALASTEGAVDAMTITYY